MNLHEGKVRAIKNPHPSHFFSADVGNFTLIFVVVLMCSSIRFNCPMFEIQIEPFTLIQQTHKQSHKLRRRKKCDSSLPSSKTVSTTINNAINEWHLPNTIVRIPAKGKVISGD